MNRDIYATEGSRRRRRAPRRSRFLPTPRVQAEGEALTYPESHVRYTPPFVNRRTMPPRPPLHFQRSRVNFGKSPQGSGRKTDRKLGVESIFRSVRGVSFPERTPEQTERSGPVPEKATLADMINKISGRAKDREREHTVLSMLEKHRAIFTPSKLMDGYDRQGYTLAERLVMSALKKDRDDPTRRELLIDLEQVLKNGGRYSPNNPLFADLSHRRDADILGIFASGDAGICDTLLDNALKQGQEHDRARELEKLKAGIVKKFLGGNIEGAKEDLRKLGEEDRLETAEASAAALWAEGLRNQSPEQLALSASLTPGMAAVEKSLVADRLKTWLGARDEDRETLAREPKWQELLSMLGSDAPLL